MDHKRLYREKRVIDTLYQNLKVSMFGVMGTSLFTAVALWNQVDGIAALWWVTFIWVVCIARLGTVFRFKRTVIDENNQAQWQYLFMFGTVLNGLGSGFLCFYFFDLGVLGPDTAHDYDLVFKSILVLLVYAGFVAGNVACNYCHLGTYLSGTASATGLVLFGLIFSDGEPAITLAALVLIFFLVMLSFAQNLKKHFEGNVDWSYERDKTVDDLEKKTKEAENAVKAKANFFASASHDLRQPLHALGLFQDVLRKRIEDPESLVIMDKISNSTNSLSSLLHSMLDISKLEASTVKNKPVRFNLRSNLENLRVEYEEISKEKGLGFIFRVPTNINVLLDPVLFDRVVRNLVDNAIKYTAEGHVSIVVKKDMSLNRWIMAISDTGHGIPIDKQSEVFAEFSQLDNPERDRRKGLGLGLSIVDRLCLLMGIEIQLESVFSQSTNVYLTLPEEGEISLSNSEGEDGRVSPIGERQPKVLMVDDDEEILDATALLLELKGKHVVTAKSEADALAVSAQEVIYCIVSDYRLEDSCSGLELIQKIRQKEGVDIPAILITGRLDPELLVVAEKAAVTVLEKPLQGDDLIEVIDEALL